MGSLAVFSGFLSTLSEASDGTDARGAAGADEPARRSAVGHALMNLLDADFFASCRAGADGAFTAPVWINMSDANMRSYQEHFQFHDPLTPRMRAAGRACRVEDAMEPRSLRATAFHRDFLAVDGLVEGMNYFPARSLPGTLDLRLWRAAGRAPFTDAEAALLQAGGELIQRLLPADKPTDEPADEPARTAARITVQTPSRTPSPEHPNPAPGLDLLTRRESEVAAAVARGLSDREACRALGCSMGTLRTHLSRVFTKLGVGSRGQLIALLAVPTR